MRTSTFHVSPLSTLLLLCVHLVPFTYAHVHTLSNRSNLILYPFFMIVLTRLFEDNLCPTLVDVPSKYKQTKPCPADVSTYIIQDNSSHYKQWSLDVMTVDSALCLRRFYYLTKKSKPRGD